MAFFSEFPGTRTYDSDLGWLLYSMRKQLDQMAAIIDSDDYQKQAIEELQKKIDAIISAIETPVEEWNPEHYYKMFQTVSYNGIYYTALKDVPSGIGILDANYWTESDGVRTVIALMQSDIADMQEAIDALSVISTNPEYRRYEIAGKTILCKFKKSGSYQLLSSSALSYSDLLGEYTNYFLQSVESVGDNRFLFGFTNANSDNSVLVLTDAEFNVIARYNMDLGHCNDLAYDPDNSLIYVAPMGTGIYANHIVILDALNFTVKNAIDTGSAVFRIAYDSLNKLVYTTRDGELSNTLITEIREPNNLNIIAAYTKNGLNTIIENAVDQSGICLDGNYYQEVSVFGYDKENQGTYLINQTPDGEYSDIYAFNTTPGDELESFALYNNKLYAFSANLVTGMIHVYLYGYNYKSSAPQNNILTGYGTFLKDNDNINNIPDGKYVKPIGAINVINWAAAVAAIGGTMIQFAAGYDHTYQIIFANNGAILCRTRATSGKSGTWSAWRSIGYTMPSGFRAWNCAGYLTSASKQIVFTIPEKFLTVPSLAGASITARGVTGYLINMGNLNNYNVTYSSNDGIVNVTVSNQDDSAFNGTNNTPVTVYISKTF